MKTKEELDAIKADYESVQEKLKKLNDEEMSFVTGGIGVYQRCPKCGGIMIASYRELPSAPGVTFRVFICQNQYCRNEIVM